MHFSRLFFRLFLSLLACYLSIYLYKRCEWIKKNEEDKERMNPLVAGDARLVGEDGNDVALRMQTPDLFRYARKEPPPIGWVPREHQTGA